MVLRFRGSGFGLRVSGMGAYRSMVLMQWRLNSLVSPRYLHHDHNKRSAPGGEARFIKLTNTTASMEPSGEGGRDVQPPTQGGGLRDSEPGAEVVEEELLSLDISGELSSHLRRRVPVRDRVVLHLTTTPDLNLRTNTSHKCAAVPRRARIQGSQTFVSLESNKEGEKGRYSTSCRSPTSAHTHTLSSPLSLTHTLTYTYTHTLSLSHTHTHLLRGLVVQPRDPRVRCLLQDLGSVHAFRR